ncbi:MAG: UDP-2,3-diacylglucosamine diphosphatase LpxI [Phycisphaerales bacterium]|nr:UDP-2,3-diacylglucosamine diphosphatase LpxI [Phycisphaerales bacterium]
MSPEHPASTTSSQTGSQAGEQQGRRQPGRRYGRRLMRIEPARISPLAILPDPPSPPTPVGIIAGGGRLPIIVTEGFRKLGHPVHGVGLYGQYDPALPGLCDSFRRVGLLRVGSWAKALRRAGVRHAVMVGKVDKAKIMHDPFKIVRNLPDYVTLKAWLLELRHDRRSHAVLAAIADELDRSGVSLMDSTASIRDQLAHAGVMTRTRPTPQQQADIDFVWPMLCELLRLDIGQAIAVRDRDTISVEAVEGTDAMIERTGKLCRAKGWTLCKGSRAGHDRRSDVPTIGEHTIRNLHANGGRCLALAADDVIMIDKAEVIQVADKLGVAIVGVPTAQP